MFGGRIYADPQSIKVQWGAGTLREPMISGSHKMASKFELSKLIGGNYFLYIRFRKTEKRCRIFQIES